MRLAIDVLGIPITLPAWVQVSTYILLALLGLGIAVSIWRTAVMAKHNTLLGEVHAKVNIILLVIKGWQDRYEVETNYANEHYAPDTQIPAEVTDEHERYDK